MWRKQPACIFWIKHDICITQNMCAVNKKHKEKSQVPPGIRSEDLQVWNLSWLLLSPVYSDRNPILTFDFELGLFISTTYYRSKQFFSTFLNFEVNLKRFDLWKHFRNVAWSFHSWKFQRVDYYTAWSNSTKFVEKTDLPWPNLRTSFWRRDLKNTQPHLKLLQCTSWNYSLTSIFFWCPFFILFGLLGKKSTVTTDLGLNWANWVICTDEWTSVTKRLAPKSYAYTYMQIKFESVVRVFPSCLWPVIKNLKTRKMSLSFAIFPGSIHGINQKIIKCTKGHPMVHLRTKRPEEEQNLQTKKGAISWPWRMRLSYIPKRKPLKGY